MNPQISQNIEWAWNLTATCLTAIEVIIIIAATIFGIRQLRENTRLRQVDVMGRIFDDVSTQEVREARKRIRSLDLPSDLAQLSSQQKEDMELVMIRWARVGVLLEQNVFGLKDEDILFRAYSWSIDNSWEILKRYVYYQRQQTGMPDYYYHFELVAKRARTWRETRGLPTWPRQSTEVSQTK